jgi:multidrug efflux pump subunit AcrA (membrane-fusion protein)
LGTSEVPEAAVPHHEEAMNSRFPAAFATALLILIAPAGCAKPGAGPGGPPPLAVEVGKARRGDIAAYLSLDGQIAPFQDAQLALQQAGTLVGVYSNEGDAVRKGELLAKIDDSTFRAQLASDEALITQAQAKLRGSVLTHPITSQQQSSALVTAERQLSTARAALETAGVVNRSDEALYKQGYVSEWTIMQSRSSYVAAKDAVTNADASLAAARRGLGQVQVQSQDIESNRGALDQARAEARLLRAELDQTSLYAPFDGVITRRVLDPGAQAGPNQPILRISQLDPVYVNANVPDEELTYVRRGTPVSFTTPSLPGRTFEGTVHDVNAIPTSGTLSYRARLVKSNPGLGLRGGMLVTVRVRKSFHRGVVIVPRSAVFESPMGTNVFTVDGNKAKAIPVKVGIATDTESEVEGSGLSAGTAIITTRPDALQDGSAVAYGSGAPGAHP